MKDKNSINILLHHHFQNHKVSYNLNEIKNSAPLIKLDVIRKNETETFL